MNHSQRTHKIGLAVLSLTGFLMSPLAPAQEASPECRGVAAGIVAAMRSTGELSTNAETEIAVVAARRACMAARDDLGTTPSATDTVVNDKTEAQEKVKLWDLLSSDQDSKPGSKRLKRLRQQ